MVTGKKQYKFNNIVATLLEGKEYMLGKGRSYVQQAGIKSSSDFENVQKYTPEQFNAGIKSVNRGYISEPPEVKATSKKIGDAMLNANTNPIFKKQLEDILTGYMTDYNELENFLREAGRMATAIESLQKALENAEGRKDLDKAAYYHDEIVELTDKYEDKLASIEHIYGKMMINQPIIFDELCDILQIQPELKRYAKMIDGRKKEAQKGISVYYMLYDYIKSFSHFWKNVLNNQVEIQKKHHVTLKANNLPESLNELRKWIKKGSNAENKDKAVAIVQSLTPETEIEQQLLQQLIQAIEAFYGGTGNEAKVIQIIYNLSPANKRV